MARLVKVKLTLPDGDHLLANRTVTDGSGQWARKIKGITANRLSVGLDRSFERGGFELTIDDIDQTFLALMKNETNRKIYGSTVTLYAYKDDGQTLIDTITASIMGWKREDDCLILECEQEFTATLGALPEPVSLVFSLTDWPNAYGTTIGQVVPMPQGTQSESKGAVTAYYVKTVGDLYADWTTCRYLYVHTWSDPGGAARCVDITQAFTEGVEFAEDPTQWPNWTHYRDANGWEILEVAPPPPRDGLLEGAPLYITVNGEWSTESSATQNPVEVLDAILTDAGLDLIDDGDGGSSNDDFRDWCDAEGWAHNGLTPDNMTTVKEYIETWAHDFDAWWRISSDGKIHIKHLDWSSVTADVTLTERHFADFKEHADMDDFANRIKASFNYLPTESTWLDTEIVDSTGGDYLPATLVKQREDEYVMFAYTAGQSHPATSALKWVDHPLYIVDAVMDLYQYEQLGMGLFTIADVTHYNQIGDSGKYFVMSEAKDYVEGSVEVRMIRLWGV